MVGIIPVPQMATVAAQPPSAAANGRTTAQSLVKYRHGNSPHPVPVRVTDMDNVNRLKLSTKRIVKKSTFMSPTHSSDKNLT
jgi:hypothetical protein